VRTPGIWQVTDGWGKVGKGVSVYVRSVEGKPVVSPIGGCHLPDDEAQANAWLIAAAPELLEALKLALSYTLATQLMDTQAVQQMIDAIAKAEGR
jgi:hypothetical protein